MGEHVAILESYEHENGTAGPSQTRRQVRWLQRAGNAEWGPTFQTTMDYDLLGNPTSMGYPTCVVNTGAQGGAIPCNDGDDTPAPTASSSYTYNEGLMRTSTLSLGPNATFTYHHNLQFADTTFGNGLVGANVRGTNGMVRPARRVVGVDENNILWNSGAYGYDEAGNIKSIGDDTYRYARPTEWKSREMMIQQFSEFRILLLAVSLLVVAAACDFAPPPPQIEFKDGFLTVHLETMGEYPTTVSRVQVSENATGTLVWEIVGSHNNSQLWSVDLRQGVNNLASSRVPDGKYSQTIPGSEEPFILEQDKSYRFRVWGESGKTSSVTFSFQEKEQ